MDYHTEDTPYGGDDSAIMRRNRWHDEGYIKEVEQPVARREAKTHRFAKPPP